MSRKSKKDEKEVAKKAAGAVGVDPAVAAGAGAGNFPGGKHFRGFIQFIQNQGIIGLAVGFVLGGKASQLVSALVNDLINPPLGLALGKVNLRSAAVNIGSVKLYWGDFLSTFIDFLIVALVVYLGVEVLGLNKLDTKEK